MARGKKTTTGGGGDAGGTTQSCPQVGTLIVMAHLVSGNPRPFPHGLDLAVSQAVRTSATSGGGGPSGKTDGEGVREFKDLVTNLYTVTASLSAANAKKYELLGTGKASANVPAEGSTMVNFDIVPLLDLDVRVKVKGTSPPQYLKPQKVALKEAKGRFETSPKPNGTWAFRKLHPGRVGVDVTLSAEDKEKYDLVETAPEHLLTESPQPNIVELEVLRRAETVPLYFAFRFLDPEGKARALPGRFPVKVRLSELAPAKPGDGPPGPDTYDAELSEAGLLVPAGESAAPFRVPRSYKKLTIDLTQADPHFVICEAPKAPVSGVTVKYENTPEFKQRLRDGRGFMLPWKRTFTLETAEWEIKDGAQDAKPRLAQLSDPKATFGTPAQMVILTLKPRWQFARFTYFDRYYGFTGHDKKQISLTPVNLRGFRVIPGKAAVKEAEDAAAAAAAAGETERSAFEALAVAQDDRDIAYSEGSYKIYLKNLHDANPGDPRPAKVDPEAAAAQTRRANADAALPPLQTACDNARTAAENARATAATKLAAAKEAWDKEVADTVSNWSVLPDDDDRKRVQCLPWVLNRKPDGSADPGLDADVVLEFFTSRTLYIEARSAADRAAVTIPDGDARLQPGVGRLKIYDPPRVWRSRRYFVRLGAKANRFEQLADTPSTVAEPFTFSLDDIVLCRRIPAGGGAPSIVVLDDRHWNPAKRCAIFHHRFHNTAVDNTAMTDVSLQGVYRPDSSNDLSFQSEVPSGSAAGGAGDVTVERDRNYIADYPAWTRLVIALGNVFDVFDRRSPASLVDVSGARAGVCWHDATGPRSDGTFTYQRLMPAEATNATWQDIAFLNQLPTPGKVFVDGTRPGDWGHQFLRIQPFMEFRTPVRYRERFNPANDEGVGRIDYILVRCCGVRGSDPNEVEHAVNLHYTRNFFVFVPNAATALASTHKAQAEWQNLWSVNVMNRWNGDDANNPSRAKLVPVSRTDGAAPPKVECDVLWFMQVVDRVRAHFMVKVEQKVPEGRDNRGGFDGSGESKPASFDDPTGAWFPSAHESGHADGLADEYNEKWWAGSLGEMSYKSNLPGDPFSMDVASLEGGSPMMNGNDAIRNRFFWPSAEWVRRRLVAAGVTLQMRVEHTSPPPGLVRYDKYQVLPHGTERRTYAFWPVRSDVDQSLAGIRGRRNLYLYLLGAEQWTVSGIFRRHHGGSAPPNPAEPYDGILVITLHLEFLLPRWTSGTPPAVDWSATNNNRRRIFQLVQQEVDKHCNFRFRLKGTVDVDGAVWRFRRCLVHFSPRFLDANYRANAATKDADIDPSVDGLRKSRGTHFLVRISHDTANPANCRWAAGVGEDRENEVLVNVDLTGNVKALEAAQQVVRTFGPMLGVNKSVNAITGPDLLPLLANLNVQGAEITNV